MVNSLKAIYFQYLKKKKNNAKLISIVHGYQRFKPFTPAIAVFPN